MFKDIRHAIVVPQIVIFRADLRRAFSDALDGTKKTHEEVAEAINHRLGVEIITKAMLDYLTRSSEEEKPFRFPLELVSTFCEVTGSDELALLTMGQRLRGLVEQGERVSTSAALLNEIRECAAKLTISKTGNPGKVK